MIWASSQTTRAGKGKFGLEVHGTDSHLQFILRIELREAKLHKRKGRAHNAIPEKADNVKSYLSAPNSNYATSSC